MLICLSGKAVVDESAALLCNRDSSCQYIDYSRSGGELDHSSTIRPALISTPYECKLSTLILKALGPHAGLIVRGHKLRPVPCRSCDVPG